MHPQSCIVFKDDKQTVKWHFQCRYILYENTGPNGYKARRMPELAAQQEKWPPQTEKGSPYSVMTKKILEVMEDKDSDWELHVTGHRYDIYSSIFICLSGVTGYTSLYLRLAKRQEMGPDSLAFLCLCFSALSSQSVAMCL